MYLNEQGRAVACAKDDTAGLYIQARSGEIVPVKLPPDACGFQIGETSQIMSGGVLQATPHAVRPTKQPGITREAFAVFLEPDFEDPLELPTGKTAEDVQATETPLPPSVSPLRTRWKPGQTFGDFHEATVSSFTL
jgi:isopenicillin N synthase-like dioxygenase